MNKHKTFNTVELNYKVMIKAIHSAREDEKSDTSFPVRLQESYTRVDTYDL